MKRTIDVGFIAKGPGLMGRPVVRDIRRLRETLLVPGSKPAIELSYVIPGRLGRADFDGFELARSRADGRHPIVFIDVPTAVAKAQEPMAELIELGRQAIGFAKAALSAPRAPAVDFDDLQRILNEAHRQLVQSDQTQSSSPTIPTQSSRQSTASGWPPPNEDPSIEVPIGHEPSPLVRFSRSSIALDPSWGNDATRWVEIELPAGETFYDGAAASQGGLMGGGNQVFIPVVEESWVVARGSF